MKTNRWLGGYWWKIEPPIKRMDISYLFRWMLNMGVYGWKFMGGWGVAYIYTHPTTHRPKVRENFINYFDGGLYAKT